MIFYSHWSSIFYSPYDPDSDVTKYDRFTRGIPGTIFDFIPYQLLEIRGRMLEKQVWARWVNCPSSKFSGTLWNFESYWMCYLFRSFLFFNYLAFCYIFLSFYLLICFNGFCYLIINNLKLSPKRSKSKVLNTFHVSNEKV